MITFPSNIVHRLSEIIGMNSRATQMLARHSGLSMEKDAAAKHICDALKHLPQDEHLFVNGGRVVTSLFGIDNPQLYEMQKRVDALMGWSRNEFSPVEVQQELELAL